MRVVYTPDAKLFQDYWKLDSNPFPTLGADTFDDSEILSLFELDRSTTIQAFALQNTIIEGHFGTGKTMLLKAVYSFYYAKMLVDIAERGRTEILPVYIRLSDIQPSGKSDYTDVILHCYRRILDTRSVVAEFLKTSGWFDKFKYWLGRLSKTGHFVADVRYAQLSASTVTTRLKSVFSAEGSVGHKWIKSLSAAFEQTFEKELQSKPNPGVLDLESLFDNHFSQHCDKILLLIDEVDRMPESFYEKKKGNYSQYENFFNQLRTNRRFLYKVAVYPETESSRQVEGSRIGGRIKLGFNPKEETEFSEARDFFQRVLNAYISKTAGTNINPTDYFIIQNFENPRKYTGSSKDVSNRIKGDSLEQLIFGSNGIIRRFIKLAGDSMTRVAMKNETPRRLVSKFDVYDSMREFGHELITRLPENQQAMIDRIAYFLKRHQCFRFRPLINGPVVMELFDRTKQDNILYPILDQRRKGTNYFFEFDYTYCVYRNVPTHSFLNAERPTPNRTLVNGKWITRSADIPRHVFELDSRINGAIKRYDERKGFGFIDYLPEKDLFFHKTNVVSLNGRKISVGTTVSFRISKNYEGECAVDLELVDE